MNPVKGDSNDQNIPAVLGEHTAGGVGVGGISDTREGVSGYSGGDKDHGMGVRGHSPDGTGVYGESGKWRGVYGRSDKDAGVVGESFAETHAGVSGISKNKKNGFGVWGKSEGVQGTGVFGESDGPYGVHGHSNAQNQVSAGVFGEHDHGPGVWGLGRAGTGVKGTNQGQQAPGVEGTGRPGVWGSSEAGDGVWGESHAQGKAGVFGRNTIKPDTSRRKIGPKGGGNGVWGESFMEGFSGVCGVNNSKKSFGVWGNSDEGTGVGGFSKTWAGVYGHSEKGAGVSGRSEAFTGVWGESDAGTGVGGFSKTWAGVYGHSDTGAGVSGLSEAFVGIWAETKTADHPAIFAKGPRVAAHFDGVVESTVDFQCVNQDCAEDFDVADADSVESGTVMVLGEEGALHPSQQAYDKRVAGVISGAGNYKPGIVLDKQHSRPNRKPVGLLGKVYCKVDASHGSIEVGDLLTTSNRPGHAMKAADALKSFGSIIGKALRPLKEGQGLIPILIALQ